MGMGSGKIRHQVGVEGKPEMGRRHDITDERAGIQHGSIVMFVIKSCIVV
jgi:hypothetical protein